MHWTAVFHPVLGVGDSFQCVQRCLALRFVFWREPVLVPGCGKKWNDYICHLHVGLLAGVSFHICVHTELSRFKLWFILVCLLSESCVFHFPLTLSRLARWYLGFRNTFLLPFPICTWSFYWSYEFCQSCLVAHFVSAYATSYDLLAFVSLLVSNTNWFHSAECKVLVSGLYPFHEMTYFILYLIPTCRKTCSTWFWPTTFFPLSSVLSLIRYCSFNVRELACLVGSVLFLPIIRRGQRPIYWDVIEDVIRIQYGNIRRRGYDFESTECFQHPFC